jgi:KDO2-lipid IV(A) lauroyltransferase
VALGADEVPQLYLLNSLARQVGRVPALREALWNLEAAVLEHLWRAAAAQDPDTASDLGCRVGRRLGPRSHKHKLVLANLRTAFPERLPHQLELMARAIWGAIGRTLAEYPLLPRICDPRENRIRLVDLGGLAELQRSGRPGIFVSAHLANWNLPAALANRAGLPLTVIYRRQSNPLIERLMAEARAALGCRFLEVGAASRPLLRELQQGRSVGLLMDQRYDHGDKVPFFGVPATTTLIPARLALPLIPVRVQRLKGARFTVTVYRPVRPEPGLDETEAARRLTAKVNDLFAGWIRAKPEQWLCAKRRWPRVRTRIPKGGKISTS